MKQIFVQFFLLIATLTTLAQGSTPKVVIFELKSDINTESSRLALRAVQKAEDEKATLLLVHMNTYGGLVEDAELIRSALINTKIQTAVYIESNAASAGALISLACDEIYMRKGSSIGASTVVYGDGTKAIDKYQSYFRKLMKTTAESKGMVPQISIDGDTTYIYKRNPAIAEGMVDERIVVEGLDDSSKVITLTTDEAIKWGYCEKVIPSLQELITYKNLDNAEIITLQPSSLDKFYSFLYSPVTSYFIGLMALAAFVLMALEIFVIPGFGVAGLSSLVLLIISLMLSVLRSTNFDVADTSHTKLLSIITGFLLGLIVLSVLLVVFRKKIMNLKIFDNVVLKTTIGSKVNVQQESNDLDDLKGAQGVTASALRPMGKIIINGTTFEAKTYGEFIDSGAKIVVLSIENQYLVVKSI